MTRLACLLAVFLVLGGQALAQPAVLDKTYEAEKSAEISTAKLQLATRPGTTAIQELTEAEDALRRLKATKITEQRRKIASELELAITRLKLAAGGLADQR